MLLNSTIKKNLRVSLLTAGKDSHYALGLLSALVEKNLQIDFIANDAMMNSFVIKNPNVHYFNLRGDQSINVSLQDKILRVAKYYCGLITYAGRSNVRIFHILWLNKFLFFDRTLLNVYYKILGKKLVFTAHNINAEERDGTDGLLNRASLKFMYMIVDHIFVHTEKMRQQLIDGYHVHHNKISIIPFPVNNMIPQSSINVEDARHRLGLDINHKVLLFFGNIAPYKGLEYLINAMMVLKERVHGVRLIIAGRVKDKSCEDYWQGIEKLIHQCGLTKHVVQNIRYVPDEEVEVFIKAADVMILPYINIFQSGVTFLAYSFGLPVIAADTGSLKDDILVGKTGFVFRHKDANDLAECIEMFYKSSLYYDMEKNRKYIKEYVNTKHSWRLIAEKTYKIYQNIL
jgi:D-inositol-3-phosphate glycosyltransferase